MFKIIILGRKSFYGELKLNLRAMSNAGLPPPSVFQILERHVGRKMVAILDPSYGFEGTLAAVTREPPGIWLSDAEVVTLRSTIAQPVPQIVSREDRSEVFVNLSSVQRIEVLHEK
jgi:hypothetical protein